MEHGFPVVDGSGFHPLGKGSGVATELIRGSNTIARQHYPMGGARAPFPLMWVVVLTLFLLPPALVQARSGILEGAVRSEETGEPLAGVQVGLAHLRIGAVTDVEGTYRIERIPPGTHRVELRLIGFRAETRDVEIMEGRTTRLDVSLVESVVGLDELVIVGSRARPRSVTRSMVPIDVIAGDDFVSQGDTDLGDQLRTVVPSFNVNPQAVGDAARIVRPASLRGLAPDHTLILLNGKRRHRASVITWLGNGVADGAQGADLSVIPSIAVRQFEVLRDGASAQYGSDAIAGVLNVMLKDDRSGGSVEVRGGGFGEGDGGTWTVSGHVGLPLGRSGFANLSAGYGNSARTNRSIQRADAARLIALGNPHVANPAQVSGSPHIEDDLKVLGHVGYLFDPTPVQVYGHAHYAREKVTGGFFYRNPNTRDGVFTADGGETLLVGDVLDAVDGIPDGSAGCPVVSIVEDVPDPTALAQVLDDPNCFTFQELFPGGFTPQFGGRATDGSMVVGLRGLHERFSWDVGAGIGSNEVDFFIYDTVNASLGPDTPVSFDPGLYGQREIDVHLDLAWAASDRVHLAGGAEWRQERFTIGLGEEVSWRFGPYAVQGFSAGSNGFPGFSPIAAGRWSRNDLALYGDVELRGNEERWALGGALRFGQFETFGSTLNGKLSARYAVHGRVALRGSVSTGFRAPTPGQQNAFNVTTVYDGRIRALVNRGTIPSTSRVAEVKGGRPLDPERSINASFGVIMDVGPFRFTADGYRIGLFDRIALTQSFTLTSEEADRLVSEGITSAGNLREFQFFTNDFGTLTRGIDLVATWALSSRPGQPVFSLAFNHTDTRVRHFNPGILDTIRIRQLEEALPRTRWILEAHQGLGPLRLLGRMSYFGGWFDALEDVAYTGETLVDLEVAWSVGQFVTVVLGGQNVFNNFPDENPHATRSGNRYSRFSPFGYNGGFYYARIGYRWE